MLEELPQTRWVRGSNLYDIALRVDGRTNRVIVMAAIDNMIKGAAGQAIQNMNLLFNRKESLGLNGHGAIEGMRRLKINLDKTITHVKGFKAKGISCGLKRSGKKDLCLISSEKPAVAAASLTTNKAKAAHPANSGSSCLAWHPGNHCK